MSKSIEGVYRDGKIELLEPAPKGTTGRVIVTFLAGKDVSLVERGVNQRQAADLRASCGVF